jgi:hypothetical protein
LIDGLFVKSIDVLSKADIILVKNCGLDVLFRRNRFASEFEVVILANLARQLNQVFRSGWVVAE